MKLDPEKWYFKTYIFVIAFLCIGPLALPLAWINPRYDTKKKILVTLVVLLISYLIFVAMARSAASIHTYYKQIQELSK